MAQPPSPVASETRRSKAKSDRRSQLLAAAERLIADHGYLAVRLEDIGAAAGVTGPAIYRHFPSKDELTVEYIRSADAQIRDALTKATRNPTSPDANVRKIANFVAGQIRSAEFRGCAFLKAAAEYPDPADPIHQAIITHRKWFHDTVLDAFRRVTDRAPQAAAHFVMLRDGAMAEGCLAAPRTVTRTFLHGVDGMLDSFPAAD